MTITITEDERRRQTRLEFAQRLGALLPFALHADLSAEAAIVAKLIEAILMNKTTDLLLKLHRNP